MSNHSDEPDADQPADEAGQHGEGVGVEIGRTDGDGSTFEPEEDPEGHAD
jgi:hypothetical protein